MERIKRNVKIVCTIGPACWDYDKLFALAKAGMNVARLNFSHGDYESHLRTLKNVRAVEQADLREFEARDGLAQRGGIGAELLQGQQHVVEHREVAEERAALVHHAEGAQERVARGAVGLGDLAPEEADVPAQGRQLPDDMLEEGRLAAAGAAEDEDDLALLDGEGDVAHEGIAGIARGDVLTFDDWPAHARHHPIA